MQQPQQSQRSNSSVQMGRQQYQQQYQQYQQQSLHQQQSSPSLNYANQNQYSPLMLPLHQPIHQPIQLQQPVQRKKVHHIQLTPEGNLVIDMPVPKQILDQAKYTNDEEFNYMRYTAVTSDPNSFARNGFKLRQNESGRQTEIFVVVTMYNEDDYLFNKTMTALLKNIAYLQTRSKSKVWGEDSWKKIVICIVSDGRKKINQRVLNVLGVMGCFQEGLMKNSVNKKDVEAHLFEYTTQISVDTLNTVKGSGSKGAVPCQILFCLKEKNAKKINSHRWFFNAFGPLLDPNICVLIDVGTKPSSESLYHLWKAFDRDPNVGGACGEIYAELGEGCSKLLNPLVAAQNFEYKISNILDKPLESVCGYISVLPGAFSAYRFRALQGKPLQSYFLGESMHGGDDIFAANMYLAEDRILCFELVTKENESWILKYVKSAKAETDVPDGIAEFISQRRRWLNGSFFANLHAIQHFYYIFRSNHNPLRKLLLCLEFLYNFIQLLFSYIAIGSFYLVFYFLTHGVVDKNDPLFKNTRDAQGNSTYRDTVAGILRQLYLVAIISIFITSLGNRPQGSKWIYLFCMILFALIMVVILYLSINSVMLVVMTNLPNFQGKTAGQILSLLTTEKQAKFRDLVISTSATYGLYFLSSFLYMEPFHMFTSMIQYLLLLPSFVNILTVYAFCNLHDISWGTKGDNIVEDLGNATVVKGKDGKAVVEVDFPSSKEEISEKYNIFLQRLRQPKPADANKRDAKTKQEDYFRNFRTKTVLIWAFVNGLMVSVLTNEGLTDMIYGKSVNAKPEDEPINPFLTFIFWSVAGLGSIRFFGSMAYLIGRAVFG